MNRLVSITPDYVGFGCAALSRFTQQQRQRPPPSFLPSSPLLVLQGQAKSLESLSPFLKWHWHVLVTGSASSGNSNVVRLLARFAHSVGVDDTELLGGFELLNLAHHRRSVLSMAAAYVGVIVDA